MTKTSQKNPSQQTNSFDISQMTEMEIETLKNAVEVINNALNAKPKKSTKFRYNLLTEEEIKAIITIYAPDHVDYIFWQFYSRVMFIPLNQQVEALRRCIDFFLVKLSAE